MRYSDIPLYMQGISPQDMAYMSRRLHFWLKKPSNCEIQKWLLNVQQNRKISKNIGVLIWIAGLWFQTPFLSIPPLMMTPIDWVFFGLNSQSWHRVIVTRSWGWTNKGLLGFLTLGSPDFKGSSTPPTDHDDPMWIWFQGLKGRPIPSSRQRWWQSWETSAQMPGQCGGQGEFVSDQWAGAEGRKGYVTRDDVCFWWHTILYLDFSLV